ncbi:unnamed protein product, partial [Mesorhabditis belari]|uniref:THAP-type domain-containing protein n=1 Tax=Mesorhabditis belari TaxID=2138241 RepID=A0AAF3EA73_9BILA
MMRKSDEESTESPKPRRSSRRSIPKLGMLLCAVESCESTGETLDGNGVALEFFTLPDKNKVKLRSLWKKAVPGIVGDGMPSQQKVCARHFLDGKPSEEFPFPTLHLGNKQKSYLPIKAQSEQKKVIQRVFIKENPSMIPVITQQEVMPSTSKLDDPRIEESTIKSVTIRIPSSSRTLTASIFKSLEKTKTDPIPVTNDESSRPRRKREHPAAFDDYLMSEDLVDQEDIKPEECGGKLKSSINSFSGNVFPSSSIDSDFEDPGEEEEEESDEWNGDYLRKHAKNRSFNGNHARTFVNSQGVRTLKKFNCETHSGCESSDSSLTERKERSCNCARVLPTYEKLIEETMEQIEALVTVINGLCSTTESMPGDEFEDDEYTLTDDCEEFEEFYDEDEDEPGSSENYQLERTIKAEYDES